MYTTLIEIKFNRKEVHEFEHQCLFYVPHKTVATYKSLISSGRTPAKAEEKMFEILDRLFGKGNYTCTPTEQELQHPDAITNGVPVPGDTMNSIIDDMPF